MRIDGTLLDVELEGLPPTVNHLYRSAGRRRYKTAAARNYQAETALLLATQKRQREPYAGDVGLDIVFYSKDRRRWDIDNRVKALQDCLSMAGIIKDDTQVQTLRVHRVKGAGTDSTRIIVTTV